MPPFTGVAVNVTEVPAHIKLLVLAAIDTDTGNVGLTVIATVPFVPVQVTPESVTVGVTVIVAVTAELPVLIAVNDAIPRPAPLAARPMLVVLLVHGKIVPVTAPVNVIAVVAEPLHTDWLLTAFTVGVGLIVEV